MPKQVADIVRKASVVDLANFTEKHARWCMRNGILKCFRPWEKKYQRLRCKEEVVLECCMTEEGCSQLEEAMEKCNSDNQSRIPRNSVT